MLTVGTLKEYLDDKNDDLAVTILMPSLMGTKTEQQANEIHLVSYPGTEKTDRVCLVITSLETIHRFKHE